MPEKTLNPAWLEFLQACEQAAQEARTRRSRMPLTDGAPPYPAKEDPTP